MLTFTHTPKSFSTFRSKKFLTTIQKVFFFNFAGNFSKNIKKYSTICPHDIYNTSNFVFWYLQTCNGNFGRPFAGAIENTLRDGLHMTSMTFLITAKNRSKSFWFWYFRKLLLKTRMLNFFQKRT